MNEVTEEILKSQSWKKKDPKYLFQLQKFLDLTDNIEDKWERNCLISQMLRCDRSLTNAAEKMFIKLIKES